MDIDKAIHPIARITSLLAELEPSIVDRLDHYYSSSIHFTDPINDGRGLDDLKIIYQDLFKHLKNIRAEVVCSRGDEQAAFLKWVLRYDFRRKPRELPVVSYLEFDETGKVERQEDLWDAAKGVFEEFPLLGSTLRGMRKSIRVCP